MIHPNLKKIAVGVLVLWLVMMACGPRPTEVPAPEPTPQMNLPQQPQQPLQPVQPQTPLQPPTSTGNDLTSEHKSYLAHATVRIWGLQNQGGQLQQVYHGSGTILTPDGYILTNCHVADPIAMGYPDEYRPDGLLVEIVSTEDKPPVPSYFATILASDPTLDLAVIRVSSTLDGAQVNPSSLQLPWVPLGDSDQVKFGDRVYIFGFPGIGGDTITYSTGDVSGFDSESPVGDRAWIKTEATIAGGNSGGLASNSKGEIIGIPTQIGTGSASSATDCRRIQDTNGDGRIDDSDSCIPTGGFINGVRPVNWAIPLIQAARNGSAYRSPYGSPMADTPSSPNPPTGGGRQTMALEGWTSQPDQNNCPTDVLNYYPSGTKSIYACFAYQGMQKNDQIFYRWYYNNRETATNQFTWNASDNGCFSFSLDNGSDVLPDGTFGLEVFGNNNQVIGQAQVKIGGAPPAQNQGGGAILQGQVLDANTGRGVADILVVVLKPGIDPEQWLNNGADSDIYSYATSDSKGYYQIPEPLEYGQKYGVLAGSKKSGYQTTYGYLSVGSEPTINLPIELNR